MKNLIFIRHGKSSWNYNVPDEMRPLKSRGVNDGHLIGAEMEQLGLTIDAVFSSPAKRAYDTCKIVCQEVGYNIIHVVITNELYDFSGNKVLHFIQSLDVSLNTVLIFGHNHAFTALVNELGSKTIANVPTTGMVWLTFNTDNWSNIKTGITKRTIFPKELK